MSQPSARLQPLQALMFNPERCALADVVAPPYDLIDQSLQAALYARSPCNVIRLELNRDTDPYAAAAATFKRWRDEQILVRATQPALYFYTQRFVLAGVTRTRRGIIGRMRLEEFSRGRILPHERTFPKAKADRLSLLTAVRTNISPIFGLYPAGMSELDELLHQIALRAPAVEVTDDQGIVNQLRPITAAEEIAVIQRALEPARILIADGHHRYETALEYSRRQRLAEGNPAAPQPYDYVLTTLVAFDDPGLVILPTHRIVRELSAPLIGSFAERARAIFTLEEFDDPGALEAALAAYGHGALGVALRGDRHLRVLRFHDREALARATASAPATRDLDVTLLHALILEGLFGVSPAEVRAGGLVEYTIDAAAALAAVAEGRAAGAFLMNPPTVQEVERVSDAGELMPEKSTYFQPKLLTGLVMNELFATR